MDVRAVKVLGAVQCRLAICRVPNRFTPDLVFGEEGGGGAGCGDEHPVFVSRDSHTRVEQIISRSRCSKSCIPRACKSGVTQTLSLASRLIKC